MPTKFSQNGKYGLWDSFGNLIAPPVYDFIFPFTEGYAVVMKGANLNGNHGVIDLNGKEILPVEYRTIHYYSEGVFLVYKTYETCAFFDTTGKQVSKDIPLRGFNAVSSLKEGFTRVERSWQDFIFLDVSGNQVFSESFSDAGLFCNGLARVEKEKWGFIDKKGEVIIPFKYKYVLDFNEGLAAVSIDDDGGTISWGYVNTKGEEIIPPQYNHVSYFHQGRAVVSKSTGNYNYAYYLIDTEGKIVEKFDTYAHMDGYKYHIITYRNGKQGMISTQNEILLPFEFDEIRHEFCGMRRVRKNGLEGVVDMNNQWVVPPIYPSVHVSSASGVHNEAVRVSCYGDAFYFEKNEVHRTTIGVEKDGKFGGFPYITNNEMYYSTDFIPLSYARKGLVDKIGEYYLLNGCSFPVLDILNKLQSTQKDEVSLGKDLLKTVNYLMETDQVQGIFIDTDVVLPIAVQWATSAQMNERIMSAHLIKALFLQIKKNKKPLIPLEYSVYKAFQAATAKKPLPIEEVFEVIVPDYGFVNLFYPFVTKGENYKAFIDTDLSVKFLDENNSISAKIPKGTDKSLEKTFKEIAKTYTGLQYIAVQQFQKHLNQGKTWTAKEWKALFLSNPFYFNLALTLKWKTQSGLAFTLQEDQSLTDANLEEVELMDEDVIGLG